MIDFSTERRIDVLDVTDRVRTALPDEVDSGVCTVFVPHTTAGVILNENESGLLVDIITELRDRFPSDGDYEHDTIDDNADSHLMATFLGESVTVPIEDGDLALGTWQSILFVECDGPQRRTLKVMTTE